ncbi:MAG: hypothetical protein RLZZ232_3046 [Planctomycetota bacterium]
MSSFILFICGCLLGVLFLSTLYGDSLRLNGLFEGQWLSPLFRMIVRFFAGAGQLFDVTALFTLTHLSWVVAAVSGSAGLCLVLFLMGGGLATDAAAWQRDSFQPLNSGGVLDRVAALRTAAPSRLVSLSRNERDDSLMLNQPRGGQYLVFNRPDSVPFRPRPDLADVPFPEGADATDVNARPLLDVTFQRLGSTTDQDGLGETGVLGELIESLPEPGFVERALSSLGRDGWRDNLGNYRGSPVRTNESLPESTLSEMRALESDIRVLPGAMVASQDIRVEKSAPTASESGEIFIEISITNPGTEVIDGLLVREYLPRQTLVRAASPDPVFRDDTLTWLINDLRPSENRTLQFTVFPTEVQESDSDLLFESDTEVSALLAVTSPTQVSDSRSSTSTTRDPVIRNPVSRGPISAADVRLTIEEPVETPLVGEWTRVVFNVTNTGDLSASDLKLRLTLDDSLDHADLLDRPNDRQVYVSVKRLEPGESRSFRLEVRPMQPGNSISTAEVLSEGSQIGLEEFRLTAREPAAGNE